MAGYRRPIKIAAFDLILDNPRFRRFWLGCTLSIMGDAFTKVAFTWFVYEETKSAAVALLMVFYMGPVVVGGFCAGWALDRFRTLPGHDGR